MTYEELCKKYGEEEVLVLSKEHYSNYKNGITVISEEELEKMVEDTFFVYRKDAEYNPKYLQLIPYVLIKHKDTYLTVKRTAGDERLVGKISLGLGGHINPIDMPIEKGKIGVLHNNIIREIEKEELNIDMSLTKSLTLEGVIMYIDPSDVVSQDHLGIFYVLETEDSNVKIKESDKMVGDFLTSEEIVKYLDKSESWSRIIIEEFLK